VWQYQTMTPLEAVSVVRELPVPLRRGKQNSFVSMFELHEAATRLASLLDQQAQLQKLKLTHRKFQYANVSLEGVVPADLLFCVVDTLRPPYFLPELGKLLLDTRIHYVQIVSLEQLPEKNDWLTHLAEMSYTQAKTADAGNNPVIIPSKNTPDCTGRIGVQDMKHFSSDDMEKAIQTASGFRERYGRTF
jgi:hypothetical protein